MSSKRPKGSNSIRHCLWWWLLLLLLQAAPAMSRAELWNFDPQRLVEEARRQVGVTLTYDPSYAALAYPGGDVPLQKGVCSDVIIRALRGLGIDLQKEIHEDMVRHFSAYPQKWGLKAPDKNIDHRRVPNLATYFQRRGCALSVHKAPGDYQPGDIVTWMLGGRLPHIGIISDKCTESGVPLILHNIGSGAREEDALFAFEITGHYRIGKKP